MLQKKVIFSGRIGEVVQHDPDDADLTYKLRFSDGGFPLEDWFKEADVEEAHHPTESLTPDAQPDAQPDAPAAPAAQQDAPAAQPAAPAAQQGALGARPDATATQSGAPEGVAAPVTSSWWCRHCGGGGTTSCNWTGDPVGCKECGGRGTFTCETITLRTAASGQLPDNSALRYVLRQPQSQEDLVHALQMCDASKVRELVDAGTDVQAAFQKYAQYVLTDCLMNVNLSTHVKKFQAFVDCGATTTDAELQLLFQAQFKHCHDRSQVYRISDVLMAALPKNVLNLYVKEARGDSWDITVHSVGGDLVATLNDVSSSLTLGELKEEIKAQTSIACERQGLVLGRKNIHPRTPLSKTLREVLPRRSR